MHPRFDVLPEVEDTVRRLRAQMSGGARRGPWGGSGRGTLEGLGTGRTGARLALRS